MYVYLLASHHVYAHSSHGNSNVHRLKGDSWLVVKLKGSSEIGSDFYRVGNTSYKDSCHKASVTEQPN